MVKQKVKIFATNVTSPRAQPIEDQINEYLKTVDNEKITSVSYMAAGVLEKALVVLDIYEPREPKEKPVEKTERVPITENSNKNYKGGMTSTARNKTKE